uniref:Anoctamin n=1 Tax=Heterorhabditis bacteriophora TaxID=37862 RepID=A0A1I7WVY9_HETBA
MAFTWIGDVGVNVGFMRISMYTTPALFAIIINVTCIFFLLSRLDDGLDRFNCPDSDSVSTFSIAAANDSDLDGGYVVYQAPASELNPGPLYPSKRTKSVPGLAKLHIFLFRSTCYLADRNWHYYSMPPCLLIEKTFRRLNMKLLQY